MIQSNKIKTILSLLCSEFPSSWSGMLGKSARMFYRNLMFAIGNHIPDSRDPVYVTIPTGLLNNTELDILESALTNASWRIVERDRDYYKVTPGNVNDTVKEQIMTGHLCPYCKVKTEFNQDRWVCPRCLAYVECHRGTTAAMGFVANESLRKRRHAFHEKLDRMWMGGKFNRGELYYKLRTKLGLTKAECHVAKFDEKLIDRAEIALEEIQNEQTTRSNDATTETSSGRDATGGYAANATGNSTANDGADAGAGSSGSFSAAAAEHGTDR